MIKNVRTYRASSMPEALSRVKRELGPDAVILGTRSLPATGIGGLVGRQRVEITAAPAGAAPVTPRVGGRPVRKVGAAGSSSVAQRSLPREAYPLYLELVRNEVSEHLAARLVREAVAAGDAAADSSDQMRAALRKRLAQMLPAAGGIEVPANGVKRVALVGPAGAGKTTTLAKLAAHFKFRHRKRVALLSLDPHRLAGHDQVRRYAEIIDVPFASAQTVEQVAEALQELSGAELLLIDTPGIGLNDDPRMGELEELLGSVEDVEVQVVLPASLVPRVQRRLARVFAVLDVSRVVLTRLDEVVGMGVVLNAMERIDLELSYLTSGQNVPQDIEEACSLRMAELIFPPER